MSDHVTAEQDQAMRKAAGEMQAKLADAVSETERHGDALSWKGQFTALAARERDLIGALRLCLAALEWQPADPERDPTGWFEEREARNRARDAARRALGTEQ